MLTFCYGKRAWLADHAVSNQNNKFAGPACVPTENLLLQA